jgi:hypothetical protein
VWVAAIRRAAFVTVNRAVFAAEPKPSHPVQEIIREILGRVEALRPGRLLRKPIRIDELLCLL